MNFDGIKLRPVKLRQSAATCAWMCDRKWFLQYRMGVVLRGGEFKEAADLGSIYHKLMRYSDEEDGTEKVRAWVREQQVKLGKQIEAGEDLDGTLARKANKLFDLFNISLAMAQVFWEKFPMPEHFRVIGREIKHECKIEGVLVSGTIDKLLLDTRKGDVWVRDYKSTGRALDAIFSGAGWRLQGRLYRLLAEDYLEYIQQATKRSVPYRVRGFILDGIERPGIKLCKKDQANAKAWECSVEEAYLRRVKEWYKLEEGKKDDKVMRSVATLYTEERIPLELAEVFDRFREYAASPGKDPKGYGRDVTGMACFAYERQCPYHDLCCTNPKNWDDLFKHKYKIAEEETDDEN